MEKTAETKTKVSTPSGGNKALIERMFDVGAHYGQSKSKRHPSTKDFIFGVKNKTEIFDLEKTSVELEKAKEFVKEIAKSGRQLLLVSSKPEAQDIIIEGAESISQPYVIRRWIGGTFTNFDTIKKRVEKLIDLKDKKEKGELTKYTKKEQLLIDREIETLEKKFGGIVSMKGMPGAVFIIDSKKESIVLEESKSKKIPTISLSSNDNDISDIDYPILGNDASHSSIEFFVNEIVEAYKAGRK